MSIYFYLGFMHNARLVKVVVVESDNHWIIRVKRKEFFKWTYQTFLILKLLCYLFILFSYPECFIKKIFSAVFELPYIKHIRKFWRCFSFITITKFKEGFEFGKKFKLIRFFPNSAFSMFLMFWKKDTNKKYFTIFFHIVDILWRFWRHNSG